MLTLEVFKALFGLTKNQILSKFDKVDEMCSWEIKVVGPIKVWLKISSGKKKGFKKLGSYRD